MSLQEFEPLGDLPAPGITMLEASAGTGKTWVVAALVTRYVAEGRFLLPEMLVITFGRAASRELRDRVRSQLVEAERELADPEAARAKGGLVGLLAEADDAEVAERRRRVGDALASYDSATIATIHQFCQQVLRSLGVAGDTEMGATLVESLHELTEQVVDDVCLRRFQGRDTAPFKRSLALQIGRAAVEDPQAVLAPTDPEPGSPEAERVEFARAVRAEVEVRKRRLGILSYDDLLSRLADALGPEDFPARQRMRHRWKVVLVDEFQDTDPVQWEVLTRAFQGPDEAGHEPTMVLIGDPKQAIYAFRGGDIHTYLRAREETHGVNTLGTNWRSDQALVDWLQAMLHGAELGDPRIVVHEVSAEHQGSRIVADPAPAPVRLRLVDGDELGRQQDGTVPIGRLRAHVAADMADDIAALLDSGTRLRQSDGSDRPVGAADVAILMSSLKQVQLFRDELTQRGIPSVITGGSNVLLGAAADEWVGLLEAMTQPHRTGKIRAVGLSSFVGLTAAQLDAGGDDLTDDLAERVRRWKDQFRMRGIAAIFETMRADGLGARVLARPDGERHYTDLHHLSQVLHEAAQGGQLGLIALLEWLRAERSAAERNERTRRLDTDEAAVQIVTIHGSKGLQYPFVYLPTKFNEWLPDKGATWLFHDEHGRRHLDVGGGTTNMAAARSEELAEELRDTYVALTRAEHQVVMWWGPSRDARNSGLTRLLLARRPRESALGPVAGVDQVRERLAEWEAAGALVVEESRPRNAARRSRAVEAGPLVPRPFTRTVDVEWRRTSYSGLIRAEEQLVTQVVEPGVDSEPEVPGTVDEDLPEDVPVAPEPPGAGLPNDLPSPMADLPAGATFGSLVHGVLEHADPQAADLAAEIRRCVVEEMRWWSVEASVDDLTDGLLPLHTTSLGPLADGLTLVDLGKRDRLCELDFEFPLNGGDRRDQPPLIRLDHVAGVLRRHLAADDPMRAYADKLEVPSLGEQELRGYLSGSIDVVLRVPGDRFLVVDYKTNFLGEVGEPLTALDYRPSAMTEAMLHSHYPLQALLYSVVLHRYLRWRLPGYDPERHLGGILYLYVRGMCGPETPEVDGYPCGVFSWKPPAAMILELSDLLDGARDA